LSVSSKIRWLRLFDEYRFLDKQLSYIGEMSKEAAPYFEEYYRDYCNRVGVDLPTDDEDEESEESEWDDEEEDSTEEAEEMGAEVSLYEGELPEEDDEEEGEGEFVETEVTMSRDDREVHEVFSRLFKKIATIIHPDKLNNGDFSEREKRKLSELFKSCSTALDKRKYFILLDAAEELEIELPKNYKQMSRWISKEIKKLRRQVQAKQRTYNYMFSELETDEQRDNLIRKFLNQLFGIVVPIGG
jgi:hypothetical protein